MCCIHEPFRRQGNTQTCVCIALSKVARVCCPSSLVFCFCRCFQCSDPRCKLASGVSGVSIRYLPTRARARAHTHTHTHTRTHTPHAHAFTFHLRHPSPVFFVVCWYKHKTNIRLQTRTTKKQTRHVQTHSTHGSFLSYSCFHCLKGSFSLEFTYFTIHNIIFTVHILIF